ncbi:MAG: CBS domain-containing protein, partial [Bryobacteraceae bacterium]
EAADALAELEEETSEEILEEMDADPKAEVRELLEFAEDQAGSLMNTEYVALNEEATVRDAVEALQGNEDLLETLTAVFLTDAGGTLKGVIPLGRLFIAPVGVRLRELVSGPLIAVRATESRDRVLELFDKYNLLNLPVVDEEGRLCGVITADDIISVLRQG